MKQLRSSYNLNTFRNDKMFKPRLDDKISIGLKCGMNTGYSIVGSIPTKVREEFTAIESCVNLASRLESRARANQIIVSSHTRDRIHNQFDIEPITVKVGEEIRAFEYEREYYEVLGKII